jgi:hypothetical protein
MRSHWAQKYAKPNHPWFENPTLINIGRQETRNARREVELYQLHGPNGSKGDVAIIVVQVLILPTQAVPKFDQGSTAWLNLPRRGSFEVEIVLRKKDEATGQYVYQVQGKRDGVLHNNGEWQRQEKLSECN